MAGTLYSELNLDIGVWGETTKDTLKNNLKIDEKVLDVFNYESSGRVKLAAGVVDQAVAFQSVTRGQLVLLKSDSPFNVKVNGASVAMQLAPQINSQTTIKTPAFLAMLADNITSLALSNPGSSDIYVDVAVNGQ